MLTTTLSSLLGLLFLFMAILNTWMGFQISLRRTHSLRFIQLHRINGYAFVILYLVMMYFMLLKLKDYPGELPARAMFHMVLGLSLAPLLVVKIIIARYYKAYYNYLPAIGIIVVSSVFVLISMTTLPYFIRTVTIEEVSLEDIGMGMETIDVAATQNLMEQRCAKCHTLERVLNTQTDSAGWKDIVNRMRNLPGSGITNQEAKDILAYLVDTLSVDTSTSEGMVSVGRALVNERCGLCHDLDRIYGIPRPKVLWEAIVDRMFGRAPAGYFKPGEKEQILHFLTTALVPGGELAAPKDETPQEAPSAWEDKLPIPTLGSQTWILIGVGLILFGVILYFLQHRITRSKKEEEEDLPPIVEAPPKIPMSASRHAMILVLSRIEQVTPDMKTFWFVVQEGHPFSFQPGQFLTFQWIIDGETVPRSYSISSAPTQVGHLTITVKRKPDGWVSHFLHDKAQPGMTVEAKGPSGRFVFNENKDKDIVLLGAGSGITPLKSMLNYIDDKCLATHVTLFNTVRTEKDIPFAHEFEGIGKRLPHFKLVTSLTKPTDSWNGETGRLNADMLQRHVEKPLEKTYFICGPAPFMKGAETMLLDLGVPAENIHQESFGGAPKAPKLDENAELSGLSVKFAQSDVTVPIPKGQPLLEIAEANKVPIPSSCRAGFCGTCKTKCLSGKVEMENEAGLDPEDKANGYVLTCVGHAKTDVELDV